MSCEAWSTIDYTPSVENNMSNSLDYQRHIRKLRSDSKKELSRLSYPDSLLEARRILQTVPACWKTATVAELLTSCAQIGDQKLETIRQILETDYRKYLWTGRFSMTRKLATLDQVDSHLLQVVLYNLAANYKKNGSMKQKQRRQRQKQQTRKEEN